MTQSVHEIETIGTETQQPPSPWQFMQDRLHGRWRYALPIAVVTSLIGAASGYILAPTKFLATGYVKVDPTVEHILNSRPEVVPMYDAIIDTQAQMLQLDDLLSRALATDETSGQSIREEFPTIAELRQALSVTRERKGTYVKLQVEAVTSENAYFMAKSILSEYERQVSPDVQYESRRSEIQGLINKDSAELATKRSERINPSGQTGLYTSYPDEVLKSSRSLSWELLSSHMRVLAEYGVLLSISDFASDDFTSIDVDSLVSDDDSIVEEETKIIATDDLECPEPTWLELERLEPLLSKHRSNLYTEMDILDAMIKEVGPQHRSVRKQQNQVEITEDRLRESEESARLMWEEQYMRMMSGLIDGETATGFMPDKMQLTAIEAKSRELWDEIESINEELQRRQDIDIEIQQIDIGLTRLNNSLEDLQYNETSLKQGQTSITMPIMPQAPEKTKKMQMAIAGFLGGLAFPIGLFMLLGHVDRRAYGVNQIRASQDNYNCIGVVPELTSKDNSEEVKELASACIHRLRNRIELSRVPSSSAVIAVTSPFQGDGKTSLAFALALSYSASGFKTILVDTDIGGQSLTAQTGRLNKPGFRELLRKDEVNSEVGTLSEDSRLNVIGVGKDDSMGSEGVTSADTNRLLNKLRLQYEIIIVDTGPLLGSVEALPVVSAADGTVLTLRRGRSKRRLDECVKELSTIGSPLLGVVLNRAERSECRRYTSASRISASYEDIDGNRSQPTVDNKSCLIEVMRENGSSELKKTS